jgi:uncharacterized protein (TIGR02996 family)
VSEEEAFIRAIVDSPGDDTPRLVYADWLDDRADPRGPYLRAELEWAKPWRTGERPADSPQLRDLARGLDPVWVARVSRPPLGVSCDHVWFSGVGPTPEPGDIAALESRLGVTLPTDYRAFLLNYNDGDPNPSWFPRDGSQGTSMARVEWFMGVHQPGSGHGQRAWMDDLETAAGVLKDPDNFEDNAIGDYLPIAVPADSDYLLLGVGGSVRGRVDYFYDYTHNCENPDNISPVATSFAAFLSLLTTAPDDQTDDEEV